MADKANTAQLPLPPALKALRALYPTIETLLPPLAKKIGVGFFLKPFKFALPEREKQVASKAKEFTFSYQDQKIVGYQWGDVAERYVMLVHGWSGRAMQFHAIIESLVSKGLGVVSFDAPAHGKSEGKSTNLVEIADCINLIIKDKGAPLALVGHSLGGISCMYHHRKFDAQIPIATINSPAIADEIFENYAYRINGKKEKIEKWLRAYTLNKFGSDFDEASGVVLANGFPEVPFLICNDENDREVSLQNQKAMLEQMPFAKTVTTKGLGHVRILRDEQFVLKLVDFIESI